LKAIASGDWNLALAQGEAQRRLIHGKWTLRLEIACQGTTVQRAAELLKTQNPDLFLLPITMRDGHTCYQVFLGNYRSQAAARKAARRLPVAFRTEGNRPKPFRASDIPRRQ
jgi:septal ring-binding cell division protein DamX